MPAHLSVQAATLAVNPVNQLGQCFPSPKVLYVLWAADYSRNSILLVKWLGWKFLCSVGMPLPFHCLLKVQDNTFIKETVCHFYRESLSDPALIWRLKHSISQNHRGWKGPLWIILSKPLSKQGHPEQVAQDHVQAGFECFQRRRLHHFSGHPGPVLHHPESKDLPCVLTHMLVRLT